MRLCAGDSARLMRSILNRILVRILITGWEFLGFKSLGTRSDF